MSRLDDNKTGAARRSGAQIHRQDRAKASLRSVGSVCPCRVVARKSSLVAVVRDADMGEVREAP